MFDISVNFTRVRSVLLHHATSTVQDNPPAHLLEGAECICRQHLGPFVGVVARRVAPSEYVTESAKEAVFRQRGHHQRGLAHLPFYVVDSLGAVRGVGGVEGEVGDGKVDLAHHHGGRAVRARLHKLVKKLVRQLLPGLVVLCNSHEGGLVVAPVLHELARKLNSIPLHSSNTSNHALIHLGQHMLQGVAELVEHRLHFPEGHQRGLRPDRRALVAHHVRGRQSHRLPGRSHELAAPHHFVHPRASALLGRARVGIEVEVGQGFAVRRLHLVQAHVLVPHGGQPVRRGDGDAEQALSEREHAVHHRGQRKVRTQLLLL
mmetsp:Transcript_2330/g.4726  ORF Transcript_2330/g.4726 Transcript_2330/m.4726 type:complete len:318 (+) Transcript_2330:2084-3037(+)